MHSKLIAACATGALALLVLPAAVSAANPTPVSVTVTSGTTITAPAAIAIGSGFPGQTVTSTTQSLSWYSNEGPLQVSAQLDGPLTSVAGNTIAAADVEVNSTDYSGWAPLNVAQPVADIADVSGGTIEGPSSSSFALRVNIPSAEAGVYTNTLTWTVQ